MKIPIFIITRDRVSVLKQCIEGYKKLENIELVIHDNNSTYPPMLEYLNQLESEGIKIYKHPTTTNDFFDISEDVANTIDKWFEETGSNSQYYIVTDPDIELENPCPDLLYFYIDALEVSGVPVVGPMLRIDDIPDHFAIKDEMVASHNVQFWGKHREQYCYDHQGVKVQRCAIDTTFGLYRRNFRFKRLNVGLRVYEPYMAKHLDWYIDTNNLTEEQKYHKDNCSKKISTLSAHIERGRM